jgi:hypothetical protein
MDTRDTIEGGLLIMQSRNGRRSIIPTWRTTETQLTRQIGFAVAFLSHALPA